MKAFDNWSRSNLRTLQIVENNLSLLNPRTLQIVEDNLSLSSLVVDNKTTILVVHNKIIFLFQKENSIVVYNYIFDSFFIRL